MKRSVLITEMHNRQLTQSMLAESIGVSRPMISHIINCRHNPSWKLQQKIVAFFRTPAEALFQIDEDEKPAAKIRRNKNMEGKI